MSVQLVVTAIGEDRPGIISEITKITSACNCNIIDSRMALFGNDFAFMMLLSGTPNAITCFEHALPELSLEKNLLTMMKRTKDHSEPQFSARFNIDYEGEDQPGTLSKISQFLADLDVDITALKADLAADDPSKMVSTMRVNVPIDLPEDTFKEKFTEQCETLKLTCQFTKIQ
ncbi:glycine cleavage system protein R [Algicola sagamiensis]|uniref:glycine cleavage system protein R n=1 Tax=Algicola sagamiensis TaxID=163869 RepID=UPI00037A5B5E|nr:ACT domain-containing protein [Algicola sagamiensis]